MRVERVDLRPGEGGARFGSRRLGRLGGPLRVESAGSQRHSLKGNWGSGFAGLSDFREFGFESSQSFRHLPPNRETAVDYPTPTCSSQSFFDRDSAVDMAHIRQSRPDSGLGFHLKVLKTPLRCSLFARRRSPAS